FQHSTTGVALDGKHLKAKCASCHKNNKWADLPRDCSGCHSDFHKGGLGGKCDVCHTTIEWKPATRTIKQHKLDMSGKHEGLQCVQCHSKGTHLTSVSSCGDCHEQQHGGTKAPCATCHTTRDWKWASFV